ncbi:MAG: DNA-binding response regulator [Flavobacteriales bacterium]|nr:DNA-binding response regulator [Flavobacteriales bacterium]
MLTISAVIVEDEIPVAKSLETLLDQNDKVNVLGMAHNVIDARKMILEKKPDLVFCDIQLGKSETGFDLIEQFPEASFKLIFVTAFNEYAIKAFKYSAIDYLLKPVDPEELEEALKRTCKKIEFEEPQKEIQSLIQMMKNPSDKPKKILFKTSEQIKAVDVSSIIRLESESNYTSVYLNDGKKLLVSKSLKEYSDILEERYFFRSHQSHLINLEFFDVYEKNDGGYIKLTDGTTVPVSKRKKSLLFELLESI